MRLTSLAQNAPDRDRIERVALAYLAAEFDGAIDLDVTERKYGPVERQSQETRYIRHARVFLAQLDAAIGAPGRIS